MNDPISPKIVFAENGRIIFWCQKRGQQLPREVCIGTLFDRSRTCRYCLKLKPKQHWPEPWAKIRKEVKKYENGNPD